MTNTYEVIISEETAEFVEDLCDETFELGEDYGLDLLVTFEDGWLDAKQLDVAEGLIWYAELIHNTLKDAVGYDRIASELRVLIDGCEFVG